jgi:hypothetical protein
MTMAQRFTMRDNGDATYAIADEEMGVTLTDWVDWSQGFYLWTHLNAGVLAAHYTPAGVRLERTDSIQRQVEWIGHTARAPSN